MLHAKYQLFNKTLLSIIDNHRQSSPILKKKANCAPRSARRRGMHRPGPRLLEDLPSSAHTATQKTALACENALVSTRMWQSRVTVSPAQQEMREAMLATI